MTRRKSITPFKLAALDPGERTGFVVVSVGPYFRPDTAVPDDWKITDQGVLTVREVGRKLRQIIGGVDRVAYETWRLYADYATRMIGNDMQPSQVVGMIRYESWLQGAAIRSNGASIKKTSVATMPDWLREHMALSSEQHDQDAIMHAWFETLDRYYREQRGNKR